MPSEVWPFYRAIFSKQFIIPRDHPWPKKYIIAFVKHTISLTFDSMSFGEGVVLKCVLAKKLSYPLKVKIRAL